MASLRSIPLIAISMVSLALSACSGADIAETAEPSEPGAPDNSPWILPAKEIPGLDQTPVGSGAKSAVILSAEGRPRPRKVAIYLHHWTPIPPNVESKAVAALVDAGYTVIYPAYQDFESHVVDYLPNAVSGVREAFVELDFNPTRVVAVGATTGGALAFDLAAVARGESLPVIDAAVAINPARSPKGFMQRPDYRRIPDSTRLMAVLTPESRVPGTGRQAGQSLRLAVNVPSGAKRRLRISAESKTMPSSAGRLWPTILRFLKEKQAPT